MPVKEKDTSLAGAPYGAEKAAEEAAQVAPDQSPAAQFAPGAPLESHVNQAAAPEAEMPFNPKNEPDLQDQPQDNMLPNGMNLDEGLFGRTQRPAEPVTQGLAPTRVSDMLQGMSKVVQSPDIEMLKNLAQSMGI